MLRGAGKVKPRVVIKPRDGGCVPRSGRLV